MRERLREHAGPLAALLFSLTAAAWHFYETGRAASEAGAGWLCGRYLWLFACMAFFLAAFYGLFCIKRLHIESGAFLTVLVLGGFYSFVLPPLSAPDEIAHFMSAYRLSNVLLNEAPTDEAGRIRIRREDDFLQNMYGSTAAQKGRAVGAVLDEETYEALRAHALPAFVEKPWQEMLSSSYKSVDTTPLAYVPQAVGITAARLLGLNCVLLAYLARFCNLLFYACMLYVSMRLLPFGKPVLFGVSLLPMALHQAASCSYDVFVTALVFFFASYCLRLAFVKPMVQVKDIFVLAVTLAALGPCKFVYGAVSGFLLLVPVRKFGGPRKWAASAAAVLFAYAAAVAFASFGGIPAESGLSANVVEWAGEEGYCLGYFRDHPETLFRMVYETFAMQGGEWFLTMLGAKLGGLDPVLNVPFAALFVFFACLVLMSLPSVGEALYLTGMHKFWIVASASAALLGMMAAMLLSWTPLSSPVIQGVQGRYLLPFLPFVLLMLKSGRIRRALGSDARLLFYMCVLDGYVLLRLFSIVSLRL
ncbi:MAG: DUF2142 domain-containing protein [Lachnospiraceae bacterium]|nr:DUF2142 domain-containing protein [Lachnospiraceae bacterium]